MHMTAIAGILLLAAVSASAQAPARVGQPTPKPSSPRSNPYGQLFQPKAVDPNPDRRAALEAALASLTSLKPQVKCGMTMIPGDPKIDPGMAIHPRSKSTRYTIKAIEPPICR